MEQKDDKTLQLNTEETFEGFIFLWRKITRSWLWKLEAKEIKIALLCLIKANHKDGEWDTGSRLIPVKRGSFVTSRDHFAVEVSGQKRKEKVSPDKVYRTWRKLEVKHHFLHTKPHNNFTVISIVNYEKYQSKPHNETTPNRTTTAQEVHTNNNDNNEKKVNKYIPTSPRGESVKPSGKKKTPNCPNPNGHTACIENIESIQKEFDKGFVNFPKQINAIHKIYKAGYTDSQIEKCVNELEDDPFWAGKWDLMNVANELGKRGRGYGN